ncbi:MAG: hypothetical protein IMHGJWDQ_000385 [Candidatus Fervidibacter sp.]
MPARYLLIVTQEGHAKRLSLNEFKVRRRGTKGTKVLREGFLLGGIAIVSDNDEIIVVTERGKILRTRADEVAVLSRLGRGGKVIQLEEGDRVVAIIPVRGG